MLRRLTLLAAMALTVLTTASGAERDALALDVVAATGTAADCPGLIRVEACDGECARIIEANVRAGEQTRVPYSGDAMLRVHFDGAGCWAAPLDVQPGATGASIRVWRAAALTGTLRMARGETAPAAIRLDIDVSSDAVDAELAPLTCPLTDGAWSCSVPATAFAARLGVPGFIPRYLPEVRLRPAETFNSGAFELKRGASIRGRVVAFDGEAGAATIELVPAGDGRTDAAGSVRSTRPDKRGYFQFADFELGRYDVVVRRPNASAAYERDVAIVDAREYVLERTLHLEPLATIDVLLTPPRAPSGDAWRVRLERLTAGSNAGAVVREESAAIDGSWRAEKLEQAGYRLLVLDRGGSIFTRELLDVASPAETFSITAGAIAVRGLMTAGGEPLAAEITLGGRDGTSIRFESDADGRFEGAVPHEGVWTDVTVRPAASEAAVSHPPVTIKRDDGADAAVIALSLPGGRITGKVVGAAGGGEQSTVRVSKDGARVASVLTGSDGKFDVAGMPTGELTLRAIAPNGESEDVAISVGEEEVAEATLVVLPRRELRGVVVTEDGSPIAGASVRVITDFAQPIQETATGPSGHFTVRVPQPFATAGVIVHLPRFPVVAVTVPIGDDVTTITLPRTSSTLAVRFESAPPWPYIRLQSGAFVPLPFLSFPRIPVRRTTGLGLLVAPGTYTICPAPFVTDVCLTRTLAPGERGTVDVSSFRNSVEAPAGSR